MLGFIRKAFSKTSESKTIQPQETAKHSEKTPGQEAFQRHIDALCEKADFCVDTLLGSGMQRLEKDFVPEMALGLTPTLDEPFIGGCHRSIFLKHPTDPPRHIVFIGMIIGSTEQNEGMYYPAIFFHDDGEMMKSLGAYPIEDFYDYLKTLERPDPEALFGAGAFLPPQPQYMPIEKKIIPPSLTA